jgi:hypothetical protein
VEFEVVPVQGSPGTAVGVSALRKEVLDPVFAEMAADPLG